FPFRMWLYPLPCGLAVAGWGVMYVTSGGPGIIFSFAGGGVGGAPLFVWGPRGAKGPVRGGAGGPPASPQAEGGPPRPGGGQRRPPLAEREITRENGLRGHRHRPGRDRGGRCVLAGAAARR